MQARRTDDTTEAFPRKRLRYIGQPRMTRSRQGEMLARGQRAFPLPLGAIKWTIERQAAAVSRGYFLERVLPLNVVHVVRLRGGANEQLAMNELEALAFAHDGFAETALAFIEQQDRYGWSGTWAKQVERYSHNMMWLKRRHRAALAAQG